MADYKDIIQNIEQLYGSNNSLNILKDFERVFDELDMYVYENWIDGELVSGPYEKRYFVECTFMWPYDKMPEPIAGKRLMEYGCTVEFAESKIAKVRKIEKPGDIRPGTRKGKIDYEPIWMVKITMPKKLMNDVDRGYRSLDQNKVEDIVTQQHASKYQPDATEQQIQDMSNADSETPTA